jgi:hypothetical protein
LLGALKKAFLFGLIVPYLSTCDTVALASMSERLISAADCVRTKRVYRGQVELSPNGREVAYIIKAPSIDENKNEFEVYLRAISVPGGRSNGRLIYKSDVALDGLKWIRNPARLILLEQRAQAGRIILLDPQTGRREVLAGAEGLSSFSVDAEGQNVVYSVNVNKEAKAARHQAEEYGFPIIFGKGAEPEERGMQSSLLFLVKRYRNTRTMRTPLYLRWSNERVPATFSSAQALSLSPNGTFLTFEFQSGRIPEAWKPNPYTKFCERAAAVPMTLAIADLSTQTLRVAFDAPSAGFGLPTVWAADGRAFTVVALSPAASVLGEKDRKAGFHDGIQFEHYTHLFSVDVKSLETNQVIQHPANWYQNGTLFWEKASGRMLVQETSGSYGWFVPGNPGWHRQSELRLPFGPVELGSGVFLSRVNASSDGRKVVGVLENVRTPPDLFIQDLGSSGTSVLTDLNPEYRNLKLGGIENVEWTDDLGFHSTGYLIKPVGFEPGKVYPLIIMVKGWGNFFLADTHFQTAFPPQPLAGAGFLVLMANVLPLDQIPGGYVGKMGEAYQFIAMVKGAVRYLCQRGSVDPTRVGLIGFSSTSWQTDFMITHSDFPFAAVSSADSGIRNYGSYWLLNSKYLMNDYEDVLGGPPYGNTLENTLRFTPAFNAHNLRSPLLMEYTGFPGDLTGNMEFFIALKRQGTPVEMFSYPTGEHDLDTPKQRIASLQRNVDWFRFWMQGIEGAAPPYDPEQFLRWDRLKKDASADRTAH